MDEARWKSVCFCYNNEMVHNIVFVVPYIAPLLFEVAGPFGGAEVRALNVARLLHKLEKKVFFITMQSGEVKEFGTSAYPLYRSYCDIKHVSDNLFNRLLFYAHKYFSLKPFEHLSFASSYVCFGMNDIAYATCVNALVSGRDYYFFVTSDKCLSERFTKICKNKRYIDLKHDPSNMLRSAKVVVVQNEYQFNQAKNLKLSSVILLQNPIDLSKRLPYVPFEERSGFLWVGKNSSAKRVDIAIEVARRHPRIKFTFILNDMKGTARIEESADFPLNIEILRNIDNAKMSEYFSRAKALFNTSDYEGMPNAFLESFRESTPVVALNVDPNQCLSIYDLGFTCRGDKDLLSEKLHQMNDSKEIWTSRSQGTNSYLEKFHSEETILLNLSKVFN